MPQITLKAARINAGYTQKEAAKQFGVSVKTLGRWESGATLPTVDKLKKISVLYNIAYDNIFFDV